MPLSHYLPPGQIRVPLTSQGKHAIVRELMQVLPLDDEDLREDLRLAVEQRELELTTGIGRGVAVPHACTDLVEGHLCAFGIAPEPLDFDAIDGRPCRLFFLCLFNRDDADEHLRLLSQLARMLNDDALRSRLEAAATPEAVHALFASVETADF